MTVSRPAKLETAEMEPGAWELSDKILRRVEVVVRAEMSRWRAAQVEDMEDVISDAVATILAKTEDQREQVMDAEAYAAGIARRMCSAWLRRRHPEFHRLRSRMRYQLRRDPRFALWQNAQFEWICGWREDQGKDAPPAGVLEGMAVPGDIATGEALARIFRQAEAPVRFNELARFCAVLWGVRDEAETMEDVDVPSDAVSPVVAMQSRRELDRLWAELRELPSRQAAALLLNLRAADGECATALLVLTGAATLRQIAALTEIDAEEFAALWRRLPLSDLEIAERMGLTRQQVINLRKCARERLRRRLAQE